LLRRLTALGVIGLCCFTAWRGWEVVSFAAATASIGAAPGAVEQLRGWTEVPGVASDAREVLQSASATHAPSNDALIELLASRPLAGIDWLSLAGKWIEMGAPLNQVLPALTMSRISAPNEEEVMLRRALVGALRWETMPEEVRGQTIHDLAGIFEQGVVDPNVADLIKSVLLAKTADIRLSLAERLRAEQMSTVTLAEIGLEGR
jgi:hypothetical protein